MKFDTVNFVRKLVAFESVSAKPERAADSLACAEFLKNAFGELGFKSKLVRTANNPILFAERKTRNPKVRILFYGHYDVQPEEPLDKWHTKPFEAVVKNGKLMGRGCADNKGPSACIFAAMAEFLAENPDAGVDFGFIFDGDEEMGSPAMENFIRKNAKTLSGYDFLMLSDTSSVSENRLVVTTGLRGIACFDAVFSGPKTDVHSGTYGGVVYNPVQAMCEVLASLHNADGFVDVDGFYDGVMPLEDWEKREIAKNPFGDAQIKRMLSLKALYRQKGYSAAQAVRALPALEFTGIGGGWEGDGAKSIIPAECFCKLSIRTAAGQDPKKLVGMVKRAIRRRTPKGVDVAFRDFGYSGKSCFLNPKAAKKGTPVARALESMEGNAKKVFGNAPLFLREGASIPMIGDMKNIAGLSSLMVGLFLPDDNLHAPNEGFSLKMMEKGVAFYKRFFADMAQYPLPETGRKGKTGNKKC